MEPFIVSARKYRPQQFEDVIGQQAITRTLENAIASNHLAQALLFCGPRGVGKTTCARILAKKINEDGNQRDGEDFAFNIFELDAASNNSVDDIRNLIDQVRIPPQVGKYKVYIIDEVHMLSQAAFNAFLKTLEEPPAHAIFILATTEKHKIIPTILSRCQIFDFRRITVQDGVDYLKYIAGQQGVEAEEEALHMIAQKADGAMRDALSIFDRVVSFAGNQLTRKAVAENLNVLDVDVYFHSTDLILEGDIPALLLYFNQVLAQGFDGHHFISGLASHFRDLMVCRHQDTVALLETSEATRQRYLEQSQRCSGPFLLEVLDLANQCDLDYKSSKNHRLLVELCLMKLASVEQGQKKKTRGDAPLIPASRFTVVPETTPSLATPAAPETQVPDPEDAPTHVVPETPAEEPVQPQAITEHPESEMKSEPPTPEVQASEPAKNPEISGNATAARAPETPTDVSGIPEEQPARPALPTPQQRQGVSGLSLSSIRAKKAHEQRKREAEEVPEELPDDPVSEEAMQTHWKAFVGTLEASGKKILAASLSTDTPKLQGPHTIWIELPNSTMKKEVERDQYELMRYLKQELNNHHLHLKITVNEETERQYAFTPQEKYEKLREQNPALDLLRKTFDLEL
ncbi:DNA polymerase III subunit gamma/tau [Robiginitalea sp. M366]|uniref:DNA polymerase III subunit gamma/tau n=1 Tax=Robiginitalea aestuariiviva TaxID=3036903 RepID=UPI00240DE6ED|nr:DNA polymerase III subunit gamma/tau [Robiginitalea aestuariiviva]MDG1572618.1 DNA polymerase III subunit gamma/tau [Robiginitalea aestuariiviva]